MQEFLKWTLESIRKDGSSMSWMEEKRLEWVPIAASRLQNLLNGHTFIVFTDDERDWFLNYMLGSINKATNNRPLLPFISLKTFFPNLENIKTSEEIDLLEDMLSMCFPNGYTLFYVGKSSDFKSQIAKRQDNSFLWLMDEQMQNSFYLSSKDELLDIKLIQLYRLMDKTIDALLFAEVSVNES